MEEIKSSKEWYESIPEDWNFKLLDPDGWDRRNFNYSFNEELITNDEFKKRLFYSTVTCSREVLEKLTNF